MQPPVIHSLQPRSVRMELTSGRVDWAGKATSFSFRSVVAASQGTCAHARLSETALPKPLVLSDADADLFFSYLECPPAPAPEAVARMQRVTKWLKS